MTSIKLSLVVLAFTAMALGHAAMGNAQDRSSDPEIAAQQRRARAASVAHRGPLLARVVPSIETLIQSLKSKDPGAKAAAITALTERGDEAIKPLLRCTLAIDDDPDTSLAAADTLHRMGSRVVPHITPLLDSDNPRTVMRGANLLAYLRFKSAVPSLIAHRHHRDPDVRTDIVRALSMIKDRRCIIALLDLVKSDPDCYVRSEAFVALGGFGPTAAEALPELVEMATHRDPTDDGLGLVTPRHREAFSVLASIGEKAVPAIRTALRARDGDPEIFAAAAHAVGEMARVWQHPKSAQMLVKDLAPLLRHRESEVQSETRWAIECIGRDAKDAVPELENAMATSTGEWRARVVGCLLTVDPHHQGALKVVLACLEDQSKSIRECSLRQLEHLGPIAKAAETQVRVLLNDADEEVRACAIEAAVALGPEQASVAVVKELSQRDPSAFVKRVASDALEKVSGEKRIRVKEARSVSRFD
jgi:HEAT repeat protein